MRIALLLAGTAAAVSISGCGSATAADPLTGTTWQLTSIESMAPNEEPSTTISDPAKYTVRTVPDLLAKVTAWQDYCEAERSLAQAIKRLGKV